MSAAIEYDFVVSLLNDPTQIMEVSDVSPALLEDEGLRAVLEAIRARQGKIAPATLHADLLASPVGASFLKEFTAGQGYGQDTRSGVDQLFRDGVTAGSAVHLSEEIREEALVRGVNQVIGHTKPEHFQNASDYAMALSNKINETAAKLGGNANLHSLQDGVDEAIAMWEFRLDHPNKITGQRVGLGYYDVATGGLKPGELIMIGGHSGEGKSQVMIHMALEAVQSTHDVTGKPARVAYFSLEMNQRQMSERFIAKLGRIDMSERVATDEQRAKARDAGQMIKRLNQDGALTVVDPISASTLDQISREMIRLKQTQGITFACVDYAQLISVGGESKYAEMAGISQRLKTLALQLDLPIVCGVQLNREALKETKSARPKLYHIADGMDLVRSADLLNMIWTPGLHLPGDSVGPWGGIGVILTEKRRSGPSIKPLYYHTEYQYSTLKPVQDTVAQALNAKEAQDLLNRPRYKESDKFNTAP